MAGTMDGVVKVKLLAKEHDIQRVADLVVDALEAKGFEVIEWTKPYPCNEEPGKSRLYITALDKGKDGSNGTEKAE